MRKHRLFNFLMILVLCLGSFGGLAGSSSAAGPQAEDTHQRLCRGPDLLR